MPVTEILSEDEMYLFALFDDASGIDLAEFAWQDHEQVDSCWRAWPFQWTWWRNEGALQIDQCVAEGQLVLTNRGWLPIEGVRVGMHVLTHRGRWKPVTFVWDRGEQDVVRVAGQGHPGLIVTPDHPIYARPSRRASAPKDGHKGKKLGPATWMKPQEWEWNDGSGVMNANWASPAACAAMPRPAKMRPAYASGRQNLVADPMSPEWLWLYGLFLAEGSVFVPKPPHKTFRSVWSVNRREAADVERMLDKVGLRHNRENRGEVVMVKVQSRPVTDWLSEHGGRGAHAKSIALWVYSLDEQRRRAVFDGMVYGDGHVREHGRICYTTVSRKLALGLRILAQSLGYSVSMRLSERPETAVIEGRTVRQRPAWQLEMQTLSSQVRRHVQIEGGLAWAPVTSVEPAGRRHVYDIEVAEDHSFICEGVIVSNCSRSVGKSLGIKARAFVFPFKHPGQEMVITAPELVHLEPIVGLVERQFYDCRLGREILPHGRSAVTHRPFEMNFLTGARLIGRIPQITGRGVKGLHPIALELDEACFPAGTMVLTRRGMVRIEEVHVGDEVLTHRNRWRVVEAVIDNGVRDTVVLRGQGHPGLTVTTNHRFWASEVTDWKDRRNRWGIKARSALGWRAAGDMEGNLWASPLEVPEVAPDFPVLPRSVTGSSYEVDTSTSAFLWLLGLYLAEGSTSSSYGRGGTINRATWSIHVDEVPTVLGYMEKAGIKAAAQPVQSTEMCANVVVHHAALAPWLSATCGRGAHFKHLPIAVMGLSEPGRQAVLDGLVYGDGRMDPDNRYGAGRWKLATTSWGLAVGTRLLAQSLGVHVSIYRHDSPTKLREIRGKAIHSGISYEVVGNQAGQGIDEDGLRLTKVKAVRPGQPQRVYDLRVAEDHSFVADGVVVHNSDYPEAGWTELIETLKRGSEGATWHAHGVTRGVRDKFYEFTQDGPDNPWTIHRITAMSRPSWTAEEREEKIRLYGSREAPDYRRNVLGLHGDQTNPLFVLHRLMKSVSLEGTVHSDEEYQYYSIKTEHLEEIAGPAIEDQALAIIALLDFPELHHKYDIYWCGMDVGYTVDPSEILIFAEYRPTPSELRADATAKRSAPENGMSRLKLMARINLQRIAHPLQVRVIEHVLAFYKPRSFGMDKTGNGIGLFQDLEKRSLENARTIRGYGFSEKVIVGIDGTIEVGERDDVVKEAALKSNVLEFSTDALRGLVDNGRLLLPWDRDLIREFQGQTFAYSKAAMDAYGRRRRVFSEGSFHALDASRMAAMAHAQHAIETFLDERNHQNEAPVLDVFMGV